MEAYFWREMIFCTKIFVCCFKDSVEKRCPLMEAPQYTGTSIKGHLYTTDTSEQRKNIFASKGLFFVEINLYIEDASLQWS